jgi:Ser/Thr protein kinase RdoA (MazF antagonist)
VSVLEGRAVEAFSRFSSALRPRGGPIGSGHINDTFCVYVGDEEFVLQRVNPTVFPYAETQMENIRRILAHLESGTPPGAPRLTLVETREGAPFWKDAEGAVWRCYEGVTGTETIDAVDSAERAYEAAKAFGAFQGRLADLPAPPLVETIPGFHDAPARVRAFETALRNAPAPVREKAAEAVRFAQEHRHLAELLPASLPALPCHNDTKVNNVLFDRETGRAVCVVDLDTAMPGRRPVDFGDLVRSAASEAPEDCAELERVVSRSSVIEALASGYLETAGEKFSSEERACLPDAPAEIAYELGVRFLTDFLEGDVYFKTHRPGQNLDRARVQFRLAESFVRQRAMIAGFIGL